MFIFCAMPVFAEEIIYLDKNRDKNASRILYEYELKEQNLTPQKAYEIFGYKESDVRAVFCDLNSDGVNEVIGYIDASYSFCSDGWDLKILKLKKDGYEDISGVHTLTSLPIHVFDNKTSGFRDLKVYPTKNGIPRYAKFNFKQHYYEYIFPN